MVLRRLGAHETVTVAAFRHEEGVVRGIGPEDRPDETAFRLQHDDIAVTEMIGVADAVNERQSDAVPAGRNVLFPRLRNSAAKPGQILGPYIAQTSEPHTRLSVHVEVGGQTADNRPIYIAGRPCGRQAHTGVCSRVFSTLCSRIQEKKILISSRSSRAISSNSCF